MNKYSSELNNLGVCVSNLEDRVGNVKVTGDVRMRYQGYSKKGNLAGSRNDEATATGNKRSLFDFRGRIQFNANVNKNTQAVVRLSSGNQEFGNTTSQEGTSKNAYIDQVYLAHEFGSHVTGLVGRFSTNVGAGLVNSGNVDGVAAGIGNDHVALKTAYGYLTSGTITNGRGTGVGYGNYDITKPGTYNLLMQYFNEDKNAFVADTLWNQPWNSNYKGWKPLLTMP